MGPTGPDHARQDEDSPEIGEPIRFTIKQHPSVKDCEARQKAGGSSDPHYLYVASDDPRFQEYERLLEEMGIERYAGVCIPTHAAHAAGGQSLGQARQEAEKIATRLSDPRVIEELTRSAREYIKTTRAFAEKVKSTSHPYLEEHTSGSNSLTRALWSDA